MAPPPTARQETFELLASLGAVTAPALCALTGIPERTAQWRLRQLVETGLADERVRPRKGPSQFSLSVVGAEAARARHIAAAAFDARDRTALDHLVGVVDLLGAVVAHARATGRPAPIRHDVRVGGRLATSLHVDAWVDLPDGTLALLLCQSAAALFSAATRLATLAALTEPVLLVVGAGVPTGTRVRFEDETATLRPATRTLVADERDVRDFGLTDTPARLLGVEGGHAVRLGTILAAAPLVNRRDRVVQTGP